MMNKKKFKGFLALNWKSGEIKLSKRKPNIGGYWVPIKIDIDLILPDPTEYCMKGEIIIPKAKAVEMSIEAL